MYRLIHEIDVRIYVRDGYKKIVSLGITLLAILKMKEKLLAEDKLYKIQK